MPPGHQDERGTDRFGADAVLQGVVGQKERGSAYTVWRTVGHRDGRGPGSQMQSEGSPVGSIIAGFQRFGALLKVADWLPLTKQSQRQPNGLLEAGAHRAHVENGSRLKHLVHSTPARLNFRMPHHSRYCNPLKRITADSGEQGLTSSGVLGKLEGR